MLADCCVAHLARVRLPICSRAGTGSRYQAKRAGTGSRYQAKRAGTGSRYQAKRAGTGSRYQAKRAGTGSRYQEKRAGIRPFAHGQPPPAATKQSVQAPAATSALPAERARSCSQQRPRNNACRHLQPAARSNVTEWWAALSQLAVRLSEDATLSERDAHVAEGHVTLGDAYFYGLGVPRDPAKAAEHYGAVTPDARTSLFDAVARKQAAFSAGYAFQFGIGAPQDLPLAKRCAPLGHLVLS